MTLIIIAVIASVAIAVSLLYNNIVKLKARVNEAWSGMDVQLKKRYDLIPKLISLVETYAEKEKDILITVTELREKAVSSSSIIKQADIDKEITPKLRDIIVVVESYPTIRSSENFIQLQNQFVQVEETIAYARKYYNGTVRNFNIAMNSFPGILVARLLGFTPAIFFEAESAAKSDISL